MRKRVTSDETLEQKILKAQEKVARTAAAHEKAVDELQILLDKRDAKRKDEVWEEIVNSSRRSKPSYLSPFSIIPCICITRPSVVYAYWPVFNINLLFIMTPYPPERNTHHTIVILALENLELIRALHLNEKTSDPFLADARSLALRLLSSGAPMLCKK